MASLNVGVLVKDGVPDPVASPHVSIRSRTTRTKSACSARTNVVVACLPLPLPRLPHNSQFMHTARALLSFINSNSER